MRAGRFARAIGAVAVSACVSMAASAASYEEARDAFETSFDRQQRLMAQVLLSAAGYSAAMPTGSLARGTYTAIRAFEVDNGFAATGLLDRRQLVRLAVVASPMLRLWGFRKIAYPGRALSIWAPVGLGLKMEPAGAGLRFRDVRSRLTLAMVSLGNERIQTAHAEQVAEARRRSAVVVRDDFSEGDPWFALTSDGPDGSRHYVCLYRQGSGVVGFSLAWRRSDESVATERIAAIMAGSLRAAVAGEPFADPPAFVSAPRADGR